MLPAEARASAGCFFEEDISDQISAIRREEIRLSVFSCKS